MERHTLVGIAMLAALALMALVYNSGSTGSEEAPEFATPALARGHPKVLMKLRAWRLQLFGEGLRHDAALKAIAAAGGPPAEKKDVYATTEPYMECPGKVELVGGKGDGSKWVCALDSLRAPCSVVSLGSGGDAKFENDILARTPCAIHTFDCTVDGTSLGPRHHYHKICLGSSAQADASPLFMTLDQALRVLIRAPQIDLLKMDIEGWEWDVLSTWGVDANAQSMPHQLLLEVHSLDFYRNTEYFNNPKASLKNVIMYPPSVASAVTIGCLFAHLNSLGFGIVFRELNAIDNQAMEFTLVNFDRTLMDA